MGVSVWIWLGFIAFIMALLAFDLGVLERKDEKISVRKSLTLTGFYMVLALIFAAGLCFWAGTNLQRVDRLLPEMLVAKARPEPDFRYLSNSIARSSLLNAK